MVLLTGLTCVRAEDEKKAAKSKKKEDTSFSVFDSTHSRASARESSKPVNPLKVKLLRIQSEMGRFSWDAKEGVPVSQIEVRLDDQKIVVYQEGKKVAEGHVSTGRDGHETPPGDYKIIKKEKEHFSNLYGSFVENGTDRVVDFNAEAGQKPPKGCRYEPSPMPFFMRLTHDGLGMHAGFLPGRRDSHGCIRLNEKFAEKLFGIAEVGTPVSILAPKAKLVKTDAND